MREFRLTITVAEHGRREVAEERMEQLLEAFERIHPEVGAVLGANFHLGRLDATFSVDAKDVHEATEHGWRAFVESAEKAELEPSEVVEVNAIAVGETSVQESDRELVAA